MRYNVLNTGQKHYICHNEKPPSFALVGKGIFWDNTWVQDSDLFAVEMLAKIEKARAAANKALRNKESARKRREENPEEAAANTKRLKLLSKKDKEKNRVAEDDDDDDDDSGP